MLFKIDVYFKYNLINVCSVEMLFNLKVLWTRKPKILSKFKPIPNPHKYFKSCSQIKTEELKQKRSTRSLVTTHIMKILGNFSNNVRSGEEKKLKCYPQKRVILSDIKI